jgi:(p)ppGpp synthase/HD superfamily hydrolase
MTPFTERIHEAADFAARYHKDQLRKDDDIEIPYASHLFGVSYILAEYEFDEDTVVAGLLHDLIEDVVEKKNKPEIEEEMIRKFGQRVGTLVRFVTQTKRDGNGKKIDWDTRNELYRAVICSPPTPNEARAISCADKIHNIESMLMALRRLRGKEHRFWSKLKGTPEQQAKKFKLLHAGIVAVWQHPIVDELGKRAEEIGQVVRTYAVG